MQEGVNDTVVSFSDIQETFNCCDCEKSAYCLKEYLERGRFNTNWTEKCNSKVVQKQN